jgi:hypothetical protein
VERGIREKGTGTGKTTEAGKTKVNSKSIIEKTTGTGKTVRERDGSKNIGET